ncbi:MAG: hypothetical protein ACE5PV_23125 [Candidatus Poribacteria bacterium]
MKHNIITVILTIVVLGVSLTLGLLLNGESAEPRERVIDITARRYAYDPPVIRVNKGDEITLRMRTEDVPHGFYLEGYDVDAIMRPQRVLYQKFRWEDEEGEHEEFIRVDEVSFTADKVGKFRYRCSQPCGSMHPFMLGEFIVEKNFAYTGSIGLAIGVALATLITLGLSSPKAWVEYEGIETRIETFWRKEHGR